MIDNRSHYYFNSHMIICVCKRVSCRDLNAAIDKGVRSWAELRAELGVATSCGRCACEARKHLRERTQGSEAHMETMTGRMINATISVVRECA